jgi:hypothetical protein
LAERKNCPSDDEVDPSPHMAAIDKAWCALMILASAAL